MTTLITFLLCIIGWLILIATGLVIAAVIIAVIENED